MDKDQELAIYKEALKDIANALRRAKQQLEEAGAASAQEPPQQPPKANMDAVTMPFGKHKGERIDAIDTDYLKWLYYDADMELRGDVEQAVRQALSRAGELN